MFNLASDVRLSGHDSTRPPPLGEGSRGTGTLAGPSGAVECLRLTVSLCLGRSLQSGENARRRF